MNDHFNLTEKFIDVEVQATKPGAHIRLQSVLKNGESIPLYPSSDPREILLHHFLLAPRRGGSKEEWALLVANQGYGLPLKNLETLDKLGSVLVLSVPDGRPYFDGG